MAVGKWLAKIQYLIQSGDAGLTELTDDSIIAQLLSKDGDVADYTGTTDSLEALSDAISAISTVDPALASVLGALADVAATGAVSNAKTAMSMIKQIVTMLLNGTYGLSGLQVLLAAIPTTAMRGTESAFLASVGGALATAAHTGAVDEATTVMGYSKQLVTAILNGTYGLSALQVLLAAIPTAMVGTDSAFLATDGAVQGSDYLLTGTSPDTGGAANTSTRIELDGSASAVDGAYDPAVVIITGGTGEGQARQIFEYDGTNKYAYVNRDWKVTPDDTSTYTIMANSGDTHVNEGVATGGGASTITLNALASAQDDMYNEHAIAIVAGTGSDQSRRVIGYNGTTKVATVDYAWIVQPDTTSIYAMLPFPSSGSTLNVPQFTGTVAYADNDAADDTANGLTPLTPKKTIAAAQVVAGVGGAVSIKAGTYVEDVAVSSASQELWCESGTILAGTGTCLTVSGGFNYIRGPLKITPASGQIGVLVSAGESNIFECVRVSGSSALCGWDINAGGTVLRYCTAAGIAAGGRGFDISVQGCKLYDCYTVNDTTSTGYYLAGSWARGILSRCISIGNQTCGYYIGTGVSLVTVRDCSSGGGDGRWADIDHGNVWSNFTYDDNLVKKITLSITGSGTEEYNLFKVTGAVKVVGIHADVETALTGTNTDCFLELYSTNGAVEISKDDDGVTLGALGKGSIIIRLDKEDKVLVVGDVTSGPAVIDQTDVKEEGFRVIQDRTGGVKVDTYIRFVHTCASDGAGVLDWHCKWQPVDSDGFLEAA